jgi:hypothetical protein
MSKKNKLSTRVKQHAFDLKRQSLPPLDFQSFGFSGSSV